MEKENTGGKRKSFLEKIRNPKNPWRTMDDGEHIGGRKCRPAGV